MTKEKQKDSKEERQKRIDGQNKLIVILRKGYAKKG